MHIAIMHDAPLLLRSTAESLWHCAHPHLQPCTAPPLPLKRVQRRPQLAFSVEQRCNAIDVRHALHTTELVLV